MSANFNLDTSFGQFRQALIHLAAGEMKEAREWMNKHGDWNPLNDETLTLVSLLESLIGTKTPITIHLCLLEHLSICQLDSSLGLYPMCGGIDSLVLKPRFKKEQIEMEDIKFFSDFFLSLYEAGVKSGRSCYYEGIRKGKKNEYYIRWGS